MHTTRYCTFGAALLVAAVLATWRFTTAAASTATIFSNNFDSQTTGALVTGTDANQFSGTGGSSNLGVENTVAASAPNALAVTVDGRGSAFAYKQYRSGFTTHTLTFSLQLGADFTVPHNDYLVLASLSADTAGMELARRRGWSSGCSSPSSRKHRPASFATCRLRPVGLRE